MKASDQSVTRDHERSMLPVAPPIPAMQANEDPSIATEIVLALEAYTRNSRDEILLRKTFELVYRAGQIRGVESCLSSMRTPQFTAEGE